jgi:hypothetical protein
MFKRSVLISFSMILVLLLSACAGNSQMETSSGNALVSLLTSQLGVSSEQALGGAGAIFSAAEDKMSVDDFASLSKAVPGMNSMLDAVPSLAGAADSGDLLGSAFTALGMDGSMIRQFMPIILGYVQSQGGNQVMGMLQKALM